MMGLAVSNLLIAGPEEWTLNEQDFANSMTYTVRVDLPAGLDASSDDMLGAFVGNSCRGVVQPIQLDGSGQYYFLLLIYSNETAGEQVSMQYYNATVDEVYELEGVYDFISEQVVGSFSNPLAVEIPASVITSTHDETMEVFQLYPVPANDHLTISRGTNKGTARVMIVDLKGKLLVNRSFLAIWQTETIDVSGLSPGTYSLIYTDADRSFSQQFIKQ